MTLGSDSATLPGSRPEAAQASAGPSALQPGPAPARSRTAPGDAGVDEWFLTAAERGNTATRLDSRHPDGAAWTTGNQVRPLLHGAAYFSELLAAVRAMEAGDLLLFTDWRGTRTSGWTARAPRSCGSWPGRPAGASSCAACCGARTWTGSGSACEEHRDLGEAIVAAGGECLLDMRVRTRGSHHQKLVVLRHRARPEPDVAYVGGIDLCHGRRDHHDHRGDEQPCPLGAAYGPRPPWHDVQIAIHGPAVADVETVFRERWEDPAPLSRNPLRRWRDRLLRPHRAGPAAPRRCPTRSPVRHRRGAGAAHLPAPAAPRVLLRPVRRAQHRPRLPQGARPGPHLVYLEDQYLWSPHVVGCFAEALAAEPGLRLIAVVPQFPITGLNQAWRPTGILGRPAAAGPGPLAGPAATAGRRPGRGLPRGKPRRDPDLRPREGLRRRRHVGHRRIRQRQPALLDIRHRAELRGARPAPRTGSASPRDCGSTWPGSTSTGPRATTRTCATRWRRSTRSRPAPQRLDAWYAGRPARPAPAGQAPPPPPHSAARRPP